MINILKKQNTEVVSIVQELIANRTFFFKGET